MFDHRIQINIFITSPRIEIFILPTACGFGHLYFFRPAKARQVDSFRAFVRHPWIHSSRNLKKTTILSAIWLFFRRCPRVLLYVQSHSLPDRLRGSADVFFSQGSRWKSVLGMRSEKHEIHCIQRSNHGITKFFSTNYLYEFFSRFIFRLVY